MSDRRGRSEIYYDILKYCPNKVSYIVRYTGLAYFQLKRAEEKGLIVLPKLGKRTHNQIVERTEKGEEFFNLATEIRRLIK